MSETPVEPSRGRWRQYAQRSFGPVITSFAALFVIFILNQSQEFSHCVHEGKKAKEYNELEKSRGVFIEAPKIYWLRLRLYTACTGHFTDKNEGALVAVATIALSIFTFTLWRATDRLWKTSQEHAGHMENSLAIAKESADAAKRSADAVAIIERAYVFMYPELQPNIRETHARFITTRIDEITAAFKLRNYGRTPAIVETVSFKLVLAEDRNAIPNYAEPINSFNFVIAGAGGYPGRDRDDDAIRPPEKYASITHYEYNKIVLEIDEAQSIRIRDAELFPIVLGRVIYRDIFDGMHDIGVCMIYDGRAQTFDQHGGEQYNYRNKIR